MRHAAAAIVALCWGFALTPVAAQDAPNEASPSLTGSAWELTHLNGVQVDRAAAGASLTFSGVGAAGRGPCNAYGGPVQIAGSKIAFGAIAATQRACFPQARMAAEAAYLEALRATRRLRVEDDTLILFNVQGIDAARFRKIGSQPRE